MSKTCTLSDYLLYAILRDTEISRVEGIATVERRGVPC